MHPKQQNYNQQSNYSGQAQYMNHQDQRNKVEEGVTYLPDLYIRKFRLVEKMKHFRPEYIPASLTENKRAKRPLSQWDLILEEMKVRHLEFKEEKKFKQASCFQLAKKIKRDITKNSYKKDENSLQIACTGAFLQIMVLNAFDNVQEQENIEFVDLKSKSEKLAEQKEKEIQQEQAKIETENQKFDDDIDMFFAENADETQKKKEEEEEQKKQQLEQEIQEKIKQEKIEEEEKKTIKYPKIALFIQKMANLNQQELTEEQQIQQKQEEPKQLLISKKIDLFRTALKEIQTRNGSGKKKEKDVVDTFPTHQIDALIKPILEKYQQTQQIQSHQEQLQQQMQIKQESPSKTLSLAGDCQSVSNVPPTPSAPQQTQNVSANLTNQSLNVLGQQQNNQMSMQYNIAIQRSEVEKISGLILSSKYLDTAKKRKRREDVNKDSFNEEFMKQANQLNPTLEFRRSKYENISELLSLYYDANILKDPSEFVRAFEKSSQIHKEFPKTWESIEEIPLQPASKVEVTKGSLFDNDYENFITDHTCNITHLLSDYEKKLKNIFEPNTILLSNQQEKKLYEKNQKIDARALIASNLLQKQDKQLSFVYKKNIFEIVEVNTVRNQIRNFLMINKSYHFYHLIEGLVRLWGNNWRNVSRNINQHPMCKDFYMNELFCQSLYVDYLQKQKTKVIDLEQRILPDKGYHYIEMAKVRTIQKQNLKQKQLKEASSQQDHVYSVDQLTQQYESGHKMNKFRKNKKQLSKKFSASFKDFQKENKSLFGFLADQQEQIKQQNIHINKRMNKLKMEQEGNNEGIDQDNFEEEINPNHHPIFSLIRKQFNQNSRQMTIEENKNQEQVQTSGNFNKQSNLAKAKELKETLYKNKEIYPPQLVRRKKVINDHVIPLMQILSDLRKQYYVYMNKKSKQEHHQKQYMPQMQNHHPSSQNQSQIMGTSGPQNSHNNNNNNPNNSNNNNNNNKNPSLQQSHSMTNGQAQQDSFPNNGQQMQNMNFSQQNSNVPPKETKKAEKKPKKLTKKQMQAQQENKDGNNTNPPQQQQQSQSQLQPSMGQNGNQPPSQQQPLPEGQQKPEGQKTPPKGRKGNKSGKKMKKKQEEQTNNQNQQILENANQPNNNSNIPPQEQNNPPPMMDQPNNQQQQPNPQQQNYPPSQPFSMPPNQQQQETPNNNTNI